MPGADELFRATAPAPVAAVEVRTGRPVAENDVVVVRVPDCVPDTVSISFAVAPSTLYSYVVTGSSGNPAVPAGAAGWC